MKIYFALVLVTVLQTIWCQDLECGGNPDPICFEQCLFPLEMEVVGRTVRCEQEYPAGCFVNTANLACTNISVPASDLVSFGVTDTIALCRAMLFQIFPDAFLNTAGAAILDDNSGTLAFTFEYEWVDIFSSEYIGELLCPYTEESAIQQSNEIRFLSNDKTKHVEIKSDK